MKTINDILSSQVYFVNLLNLINSDKNKQQ